MVSVLSDLQESDLNRDGFDDVPEVATFCIQGADFRVHRGLCPTMEDADGNPLFGQRAFSPVMDTQPAEWFVRVVFSELLDPSVEELVDLDGDGVNDQGTIANTKPLTLTCGGVEIPYDGFYDPSGNDVTYPPGPALVISLPDYGLVPSGTQDCSVTVSGSVTDKEGNAVLPEHQGPYTFGIGDMRLTTVSPRDGSAGVAIESDLGLGFNANVNPETVGGAITLQTGDTVVPLTVTLASERGEEVPTQVTIDPDVDLTPGTEYTLTINTTGIQDIAGGGLTLPEPQVITFTTEPAAPAPEEDGPEEDGGDDE